MVSASRLPPPMQILMDVNARIGDVYDNLGLESIWTAPSCSGLMAERYLILRRTIIFREESSATCRSREIRS